MAALGALVLAGGLGLAAAGGLASRPDHPVSSPGSGAALPGAAAGQRGPASPGHSGIDPDGADFLPVPPLDLDRGSVLVRGLDRRELDDPHAALSVAPVRLDDAHGRDVRLTAALPARIELYSGTASIVPGQPLELHVSTPGTSYRFVIERRDATLVAGSEVVVRSGQRPGGDFRSLATFDNLTRTARANWPVTDRLATAGWQPGVYLVRAEDSAGSVGRAIFVVRTPVLAPDAPAFMFTALTYQAYNLWGGANLYSYTAPQAARVSFERPYDQGGGRGFWTRYDDRILAWLQRQGLPLQYTTDYDLASDPPEVAPRLLVLPQHAEYVPRTLRDWVHRHVNEHGDMNLVSFGANGFYWQVRLATPRSAGASWDLICYKDPNADPAAGLAPALVTTRWRDEPVGQPEGLLLGAQYAGVLGDAATRYDLTVTTGMPGGLLEGTGWRAGTVVRGLLLGEGDSVAPGSGGIAVMEGRARDPAGRQLIPTVTIRTSPAGARVFMAGTFAWVDGFSPARVSLGVPVASFERFNRNILAWLGDR